jgi:hypothetical protein
MLDVIGRVAGSFLDNATRTSQRSTCFLDMDPTGSGIVLPAWPHSESCGMGRPISEPTDNSPRPPPKLEAKPFRELYGKGIRTAGYPRGC